MVSFFLQIWFILMGFAVARSRPLSCGSIQVLDPHLESFKCCRFGSGHKSCDILMPLRSFKKHRVYSAATLKEAQTLLPNRTKPSCIFSPSDPKLMLDCCNTTITVDAPEEAISDRTGKTVTLYHERQQRLQAIVSAQCLSKVSLTGQPCRQAWKNYPVIIESTEYPGYLQFGLIKVKHGCICSESLCVPSVSKSPKLIRTKRDSEDKKLLMTGLRNYLGTVIDSLTGLYKKVMNNTSEYQKNSSEDNLVKVADTLQDAGSLLGIGSDLLRQSGYQNYEQFMESQSRIYKAAESGSSFTDSHMQSPYLSTHANPTTIPNVPVSEKFSRVNLTGPTMSSGVSDSRLSSTSPTVNASVSDSSLSSTSPTVSASVSDSSLSSTSPTVSASVSDSSLSSTSPTVSASVSDSSLSSTSPTVSASVSDSRLSSTSPTVNASVSDSRLSSTSPTVNASVSDSRLSSTSPTVNASVSDSRLSSTSPTVNASVSDSRLSSTSPTVNASVSDSRLSSTSPTVNASVSDSRLSSTSPTVNASVSDSRLSSTSPTVNASVSDSRLSSTSPTVNASVSDSRLSSTSPTVNASVSDSTLSSTSPTVNASVSDSTLSSTSPTVNASVSDSRLSSTSPTVNASVSDSRLSSTSPTVNASVSDSRLSSTSPTVNASVSDSRLSSTSPTVNASVSDSRLSSTSPTVNASVSDSRLSSTSPTVNASASDVIPIYLALSSETVEYEESSTQQSNLDFSLLENLELGPLENFTTVASTSPVASTNDWPIITEDDFVSNEETYHNSMQSVVVIDSTSPILKTLNGLTTPQNSELENRGASTDERKIIHSFQDFTESSSVASVDSITTTSEEACPSSVVLEKCCLCCPNVTIVTPTPKIKRQVSVAFNHGVFHHRLRTYEFIDRLLDRNLSEEHQKFILEQAQTLLQIEMGNGKENQLDYDYNEESNAIVTKLFEMLSGMLVRKIFPSELQKSTSPLENLLHTLVQIEDSPLPTAFASQVSRIGLINCTSVYDGVLVKILAAVQHTTNKMQSRFNHLVKDLLDIMYSPELKDLEDIIQHFLGNTELRNSLKWRLQNLDKYISNYETKIKLLSRQNKCTDHMNQATLPTSTEQVDAQVWEPVNKSLALKNGTFVNQTHLNFLREHPPLMLKEPKTETYSHSREISTSSFKATQSSVETTKFYNVTAKAKVDSTFVHTTPIKASSENFQTTPSKENIPTTILTINRETLPDTTEEVTEHSNVSKNLKIISKIAESVTEPIENSSTNIETTATTISVVTSPEAKLNSNLKTTMTDSEVTKAAQEITSRTTVKNAKSSNISNINLDKSTYTTGSVSKSTKIPVNGETTKMTVGGTESNQTNTLHTQVTTPIMTSSANLKTSELSTANESKSIQTSTNQKTTKTIVKSTKPVTTPSSDVDTTPKSTVGVTKTTHIPTNQKIKTTEEISKKVEVPALNLTKPANPYYPIGLPDNILNPLINP